MRKAVPNLSPGVEPKHILRVPSKFERGLNGSRQFDTVGRVGCNQRTSWYRLERLAADRKFKLKPVHGGNF
jgi:hypothetical protein